MFMFLEASIDRRESQGEINKEQTPSGSFNLRFLPINRSQTKQFVFSFIHSRAITASKSIKLRSPMNKQLQVIRFCGFDGRERFVHNWCFIIHCWHWLLTVPIWWNRDTKYFMNHTQSVYLTHKPLVVSIPPMSQCHKRLRQFQRSDDI